MSDPTSEEKKKRHELREYRISRYIERLNAMVKADPGAMTQLVEQRVHVYGDVAPAITHEGPTGLALGVLGVLNGMIATPCDPVPMVAIFDGNNLIHFARNRTVWGPGKDS